MAQSVVDRYRSLLEAASFAARAHQGQLRKDKVTPYVSHVFRVCMIVRHVFEIDDPRILMTALLHDTIEDTTTDYDEIAEQFDAEVAGWVALLSKDKRQPDQDREPAYMKQLVGAPWQVQACKLADIFDNLVDAAHFSPDKKAKSLRRAEQYLNALRPSVPPELKRPYQLVAQVFEEMKRG